jgi:hypothetical protein
MERPLSCVERDKTRKRKLIGFPVFDSLNLL